MTTWRLREVDRAQSQDRQAGVPLRAVCLAFGVLAATATAFALEVEQIESPKGIKAWLVEEHSVPLVAIKFAFAGGSAQDPAGKEGLGAMAAGLLTEGAGDLSSASFKEQVSRLGVRLSLSTGRDAIQGGLESLTARFGHSAELLRLALVVPRFDPADVERARAERLTDLAIAANRPTSVALNRWYAEAFAGHPYGRAVDGTTPSVTGLTREDLKAQHARLFAKDVLKVVIVGDIGRQAAAESLDAIFGGLPARADVARIEKVEPRAVPAPVVVSQAQPLATATFGLPSLPSDHADFAALQVLNHVIGSGDFDSRLMEEIRVKRGLVYSIQTSLLNDTVTSVVLGGFASKNENMGAALGVLREVLANMARDGPTPEQFENSKKYLKGSFLLDFDSNAAVASSLLAIWLDAQGPDYLVMRNHKIDRVTLEDVRRVARQVLMADRLVTTVVGKPNLDP
jgi:zinc protease